MRGWITKTGSSYVARVAGIELYGSFGKVPDRAFGPLGVSSAAPTARAARSR